jgi:hypothetical protein
VCLATQLVDLSVEFSCTDLAWFLGVHPAIGITGVSVGVPDAVVVGRCDGVLGVCETRLLLNRCSRGAASYTTAGSTLTSLLNGIDRPVGFSLGVRSP